MLCVLHLVFAVSCICNQLVTFSKSSHERYAKHDGNGGFLKRHISDLVHVSSIRHFRDCRCEYFLFTAPFDILRRIVEMMEFWTLLLLPAVTNATSGFPR